MPRVTIPRNPVTAEVARALRCSEKTIARARIAGEIGASRAGRTYVLDFDDVTAWAAARGFEVVPEDPQGRQAEMLGRVAEVLGIAR